MLLKENRPVPEFDPEVSELLGSLLENFTLKIDDLTEKIRGTSVENVSNLVGILDEFFNGIKDEMLSFFLEAKEILGQKGFNADICIKRPLDDFWKKLSLMFPDFRPPMFWDAK